jgi:dTDP-4-dehydrorhamnose 3,5-epimerase-like enzyme
VGETSLTKKKKKQAELMILGCMFVVWKEMRRQSKSKQRKKSCVTSQRISACGIDTWLTK